MRSFDINAAGSSEQNTVLIQLGPSKFSIPETYLDTKIPQVSSGEVIDFKSNSQAGGGLNFSFWMPTKRGEPIKTIPPMIIPELMRLGAHPAPEEYPVTVYYTRIVEASDPTVLLPDDAFHNMLSSAGDASDLVSEELGLTKVVRRRYPDPFNHYHLEDRNDFSIEMRCDSEIYDKHPNPLCVAHTYFWKERISATIVFPSRTLSRWRDNIQAVRELMMEWRVK